MKSLFILALSFATVLLLGACAAKARAGDGGIVQEVRVTARQFQYEPARVVVRATQPVKMVVTSVDVDHDIDIPDIYIDERVESGNTVTLKFTPRAKGEYKFYCRALCGMGHNVMVGTLVVE